MTGNVNNNVGLNQDLDLGAIQGGLDTGKVGEQVKNFASQILSYVKENLGAALDESPKLPTPRTAGASQPSIMGMDEETIMMMIGSETAEVEKKGAVNSIKNRAQQREAQNAERIKNLQEQAEKIENQSIWDKLVKAFKIIGAVVGIVAAVAGAVFSGGSSLAIAGAIIGGLMAAETLVSTATDGKIGLGALCTKIFGEKAGPWVALGISLALTVASMGMGIAGAAKSVSDGATAVSKFAKIGLQISSGVINLGAGVAGIGSAINNYQLNNLKVSNKEMEAILAKLAALNDQDTKHLEEIMETQSALVNGVKEILETQNAAELAIVTASA